MRMDIQLVEALCGFQKPISTLDNQTIVITSHPGQIVKHGDIKCVLNEGMPIYRRPYEKGHLIIEFKVNFPDLDQSPLILPGPFHQSLLLPSSQAEVFPAELFRREKAILRKVYLKFND